MFFLTNKFIVIKTCLNYNIRTNFIRIFFNVLRVFRQFFGKNISFFYSFRGVKIPVLAVTHPTRTTVGLIFDCGQYRQTFGPSLSRVKIFGKHIVQGVLVIHRLHNRSHSERVADSGQHSHQHTIVIFVIWYATVATVRLKKF